MTMNFGIPDHRQKYKRYMNTVFHGLFTDLQCWPKMKSMNLIYFICITLPFAKVFTLIMCYQLSGFTIKTSGLDLYGTQWKNIAPMVYTYFSYAEATRNTQKYLVWVCKRVSRTLPKFWSKTIWKFYFDKKRTTNKLLSVKDWLEVQKTILKVTLKT